MSDRDDLTDRHGDRIATTEVRRLRWLPGWINNPSPWIDVANTVAVVGAVVFTIWVVFG